MIGASAARSTLAPLRGTDFRRLFGGHVVSLAGDSLYSVAAMWLVYDLTGSPAYTGAAGFLTSIPRILKVLVGPLVDRVPLRRVLVASELLQGVVALVVPLAAVLGHLSVPLLLAVMPVLTLVGLPTGPAQNATVPRIVDEDDLPRANSLVSFTGQGIRTLAQGVAGTLIATVGAVVLYAIDAATFAVAAGLYALLRVPSLDGDHADDPDGSGDATSGEVASYVRDIREGLWLVTDSVLVHMVGAAAIAGLLIGATLAVLPAFAAALGGPRSYGYLTASMTAGSLLGALLASRFEGVPLGRVAAVSFALAGICWGGAVVASWFPVKVALFGLAWAPIGVYNVLAGTTIQIGVPDDVLGRVSATTGSLVALARPVGLLLGGVAGSALGVGTVIGAAGAGFVCAAGYWAAVPALRTFPPVAELSSGEFGVEKSA